MRRLIFGLMLVLGCASTARAQCSFSNPTACGSPGMNNLKVGGIANFSGTSAVFGSTAGAGFLATVNGATSTTRRILTQTAGQNVWEMYLASPDAQSGGDTGSFFKLRPYHDAGGGLIGDLLICKRGLYQCSFGNQAMPLSGSTTLNPTLQINTLLTGASTNSGPSIFNMIIQSDNLAASGAAAPRGFVLNWNFGGLAMTQGRIPMLVIMNQTDQVTAQSNIMEGIQISSIACCSWGGTGLTNTTASGTMEPFNTFIHYSCSAPGPTTCATNMRGGGAFELDFTFDNGTTFRTMVGLLFTRIGQGANESAGQGAVTDSGIIFADDSTTTGHWLNLFSVGSRNSDRPLDTTKGRIIYAENGASYQAFPLVGLDAFNVINGTFSGNVLLSRNTAIDGSGNWRLGTAYQTFSAASGLTIDASGYEGRPETTSLTVVNGGANWSPSAGGIQSYATDSCNGSYALTTSSGVVTAATVMRVAYCASDPGDTVTLIPDPDSASYGPTATTVTNPHTLAGSGSPVVKLGGIATIEMANTVKFATSSTGAGTQTYTNSPCSGLTTEKWIPVTITGQTGTWYVPACQ